MGRSVAKVVHASWRTERNTPHVPAHKTNPNARDQRGTLYYIEKDGRSLTITADHCDDLPQVLLPCLFDAPVVFAHVRAGLA